MILRFLLVICIEAILLMGVVTATCDEKVDLVSCGYLSGTSLDTYLKLNPISSCADANLIMAKNAACAKTVTKCKDYIVSACLPVKNADEPSGYRQVLFEKLGLDPARNGVGPSGCTIQQVGQPGIEYCPTYSPDICEPKGGGMFLPLFGESEHTWNNNLRIVLYFFGMAYAFLGVALVADIFMAAIEKITSSQKTVRIGGETYHVRVWNDTVANLTLMALGSSAPEILLSVLEVFDEKYYSGKLGPSTIVGSAAFNLLCISGICVSCLPGTEVRYVKDLGVFGVTAFASVFAYLWLVFVLQISSKDVLTLGEAIVTFFMFPILVGLAYMADKGMFSRLNKGSSVKPGETRGFKDNGRIRQIVAATGHRVSPEIVSDIIKRVKADNPKLPFENRSKLVYEETMKHVPKSRAQRRAAAIRAGTGGLKLNLDLKPEELLEAHDAKQRSGAEKEELISESKVNNRETNSLESGKTLELIDNVSHRILYPGTLPPTSSGVYVKFSACAYSVVPGDNFTITVICEGHTEKTTVAYRTYDCDTNSDNEGGSQGLCKAGIHYKETQGELIFEVGTRELTFNVESLEVGSLGENEAYFLVNIRVIFPDNIAIINRDASLYLSDKKDHGVLSFEERKFTSTESEGAIGVTIERVGGCVGEVSVNISTRDETAIAGADYIAKNERIIFANGEHTKMYFITIIDDESYEKDEFFQVILSDPQGGAIINPMTDGEKETDIATVCIISDDDERKSTDRFLLMMRMNRDLIKIGQTNYIDQFKALMLVDRGADGKLSCFEAVMHCLLFPWKFFFAFIPPTDFSGGWLCFFVALGAIGIVTALISDLASLFGCTLGVGPSITAITFVALGTSLPDTFASMSAAIGDKYADASLGNVTGSNSVNVFLGLGLPWLIAAIYWSGGVTGQDLVEFRDRYKEYDHIVGPGSSYRDGAFVVPGGDLGFSVTVFVFAAILCLGMLVGRRKYLGAELGGNRTYNYITSAAMFTLWLVYILMSVAKDKAWI